MDEKRLGLYNIDCPAGCGRTLSVVAGSLECSADNCIDPYAATKILDQNLLAVINDMIRMYGMIETDVPS